ncbi:MAG: hypothetical protein NPINA01_02460 [Nitrospinaceae bacterium]|nr:MAG: hypothetical protein NPINA01_02460 [Nitrospinaceae bacterium]
MDFFATEQIWGVFLFGMGAGVLSLCSRWERQDEEWLKNPRNKYKKCRRKSDFAIPTTVRGMLMTLTGSLLSFTGITMFFLYIQ